MNTYLYLLLTIMALIGVTSHHTLAPKRARTTGKAGRDPKIKAWFPQGYQLRRFLRKLKTMFQPQSGEKTK